MGERAIVTGAAQGIGEAVARRLASEGVSLVLTDRQDSVTELAGELGGIAVVGAVDDPEIAQRCVVEAVKSHGRVDILINNAGEVAATGPRDGSTNPAADFDRMIGSNLKGHFLFGRAVADFMIEAGGGHIVNVSTDHVKPAPESVRHHGHGRMDLYNAAKWAINGLTFDWSNALAKHGIRVNSLCMGATDTAMLRTWMPEPSPEVLATWMQPEQIADVVVELLAEGPDGRTGDTIALWAGHDCVLPPPE